jgi:NAD(P)-dependent dehydrogenase (short-subunit alcohol dehydrogenase family)
MQRFEGKAIVVTGGSSGIRLMLAQRVVAEGGQGVGDGNQHGKTRGGGRIAS